MLLVTFTMPDGYWFNCRVLDLEEFYQVYDQYNPMSVVVWERS